MDKVRVLIDTDLGDDVDDAAAFMLALSWGAIEIAGVTTVFKDTKKRVGMVKDLLALYGRDDIPCGAGRALNGTCGRFYHPKSKRRQESDHPGHGSHDQPGHGILKETSADA